MYKVDNLQKMERDFMDNEVKEILMQLVEGQKQMSADISDLKKGQKQLFDVQKKTNERLDEQYNMIYQLTLNAEKMQNDIISTQADVRSIKIELEHKVSPAIKTLCEMQLDNSKRLHKLEHDMQELNDQLVIGEVLHNIKDI